MSFYFVSCLIVMIFSFFVLSFERLLLTACMLVTLFSVSPVSARNSNRVRLPEGLFFGINYPGVSAGYRFGGRSFSLRWFSRNEINIIGARYKADVHEFRAGRLYWALDGYRPEFTSEYSEGEGSMLGITGGTEVLIGEQTLFTTDFGPHWIRLEDKNTGLRQTEIEFVLNFGFNIYL